MSHIRVMVSPATFLAGLISFPTFKAGEESRNLSRSTAFILSVSLAKHFTSIRENLGNKDFDLGASLGRAIREALLACPSPEDAQLIAEVIAEAAIDSGIAEPEEVV